MIKRIYITVHPTDLTGTIPAIVVYMGDLKFTHEITNDRDIVLAYRLAKEAGVAIVVNPIFNPLVKRVMY